MLTLFAFAGAQQPDNNTQTIRSFRWLTRLGSTLGIVSRSQRGGAIKLDEISGRRDPQQYEPAAVPVPALVRRSSSGDAGAHQGDLRDMRPNQCGDGQQIPLYLVSRLGRRLQREVAAQQEPFQTRRDRRLRRRSDRASASTAGIRNGFARTLLGANPPDVNGRVNSTQYVQWNNTQLRGFR